MSFFHEDGRGRIVDESGKEAAAFVVLSINKSDKPPEVYQTQKSSCRR